MHKVVASIILSVGLILSAKIIVNNEAGRYRLFQGKMRENYFTNRINSTGQEDCILRIDTKTGKVFRYEKTICDNNINIQNKNGFYEVDSI